MIVAGFGLLVLGGIWFFARTVLRNMRANHSAAPAVQPLRRRRRPAAAPAGAAGVEVTIASLPRWQQAMAVAGMLVLMTLGIGIMYTDPSTRIECMRTEAGAPVTCAAEERMYWLFPLRQQTLHDVTAISHGISTESSRRAGQAGRDVDTYVTLTLTGAEGALIVATEAEFTPWLRPDIGRIQTLLDDATERSATIWAIPQLTSVLGILMPGIPLLVFALWLMVLARIGRSWLRSGPKPGSRQSTAAPHPPRKRKP